MSQWIECEPAYGRDYKNQAAVRADWNDNKDFRDTATGRYLSKSTAEQYDLKVTVRYDRSMKVVNVRG